MTIIRNQGRQAGDFVRGWCKVEHEHPRTGEIVATERVWVEGELVAQKSWTYADGTPVLTVEHPDHGALPVADVEIEGEEE